jgi:hypothetical protein
LPLAMLQQISVPAGVLCKICQLYRLYRKGLALPTPFVVILNKEL